MNASDRISQLSTFEFGPRKRKHTCSEKHEMASVQEYWNQLEHYIRGGRVSLLPHSGICHLCQTKAASVHFEAWTLKRSDTTEDEEHTPVPSMCSGCFIKASALKERVRKEHEELPSTQHLLRQYLLILDVANLVKGYLFQQEN